jgi:hypothetical protein
MATLKNTNINTTGFIQISKGTTGERPGSPTAGMIRFNTTFNITEFWNGSTWIDAESGLVAGLNGSTEALAAPNAAAIRTLTPSAPSGDYWIKPTGQTAYKIFCELDEQGGGWMLVASGREGRQDDGGPRDWWRDAGDSGGAFATGLRMANMGISSFNNERNSGVIGAQTDNFNPRYMPVAWIRAACGGNTWNEIEMIINRVEIGDSFYYRSSASNFNWSDFESSPAPISLASSRYNELWLNGSNTGNQNGVNWTDNDYGGSNDTFRNFTWTWSGHSNPTQYTGWSSGSARHWPGFTANGTYNSKGGEGHSLQAVHCFVR